MVESVNQTFGLATSPYTVASAKPNSEVRDVALLVFTNSLPANFKIHSVSNDGYCKPPYCVRPEGRTG